MTKHFDLLVEVIRVNPSSQSLSIVTEFKFEENPDEEEDAIFQWKSIFVN